MLTPRNAEYIQASLTGASALLGIITQILEFSKLSSAEGEEQGGLGGQAKLAAEPFSLATLASEVVDICGGRAVLGGVELLVTLEPALYGSWLVGDAFRLRQCLINLADNACKALPLNPTPLE